jgi:hypothetical protein
VKISVLQYLLPGLLIGALGGYFFAEIRHSRSPGRGHAESPRAAFLSSDDDTVNYEKLARVCLAVSERGEAEGSHVSATGIEQLVSGRSKVNSEEILKTKDRLDRLMSNALELGSWTRLIAFRARQLTYELPPSDAADFAQLFATVVQQGDLKIVPGVWVPEGAHTN